MNRGPVRALLIVVGTVAVLLGIVGVFLPLLPTTPFLLLAAWCYARSSKRFYAWLLAHRCLGPYIRNYGEGKGMTRRAKTSTLALLWVAIVVTAVFAIPYWWMQLPLMAIAAAITFYLLRLPTCRE